MTDPTVATNWGIGRVGVLGAGVMGPASPPTWPVSACRCCCSTWCRGRRRGPRRRCCAPPRRRSPGPRGPPGHARRRALGLRRARRLRLDRRGHHRAADAKRDLFARLDGVRKPGSIVSSNTSTIRLCGAHPGARRAAGRRFHGDAFLQPAARHELVEVVAGRATRPKRSPPPRLRSPGRWARPWSPAPTRPASSSTASTRCGSPRRCATPSSWPFRRGGRRGGGPPFGVPKGGVFGHLDTLGIDRAEELAKSLLAALPASDAYRALFREEPWWRG